MRTLASEGIGAFIVVRGWHLFLGAEVFSLLESSWAYLAGSFPYRDPLSNIKRGGQGISLYMQSWVASKLASRPSAYLFPSALLALVCRCRQPLSVSRRLPSIWNIICWLLYDVTDDYNCTVSLCLIALPETVGFMPCMNRHSFLSLSASPYSTCSSF